MTKAPYLWDKNGPEDAFIARLEGLLARKRIEVKRAGRHRSPRSLKVLAVIATAAAAAVVIWTCFGRGAGDEAPRTKGTHFPASDAPETSVSPAALDAASSSATTK